MLLNGREIWNFRTDFINLEDIRIMADDRYLLTKAKISIII